MSSKEYDLFDASYIFDSIDSLADGVEQHFERVSRSLKELLPDSIKPLPPPPPPRRLPKAPPGYLQTSRNWISEHRAVTAAVIAFVGTGVFIVWRARRLDRAKRRARKAKNGSRTEVVVLAGSPHLPLTRSISLELERRGFMIYIPVNSLSEEQVIQSLSRPDIRPLNLDITSPDSTKRTIATFASHLTTPQTPFPKAPSHTLSLSAFILLPGSAPSANPILSIDPSAWSETLNTRLLAPLAVIHAFLPLIISEQSNLLFLSPSILPSLAPPSHAPENVVSGGIRQYISTLRKELQTKDINIVQFQLGHFDQGFSLEYNEQQIVLSQHLPLSEATRQRLESKGVVEKTAKGTSLRELHNHIFDAIVRGKGKNGTIFVGRGARTYDLIQRLVPEGLVGWMLRSQVKDSRISISELANEEASTDQTPDWDKVGERSSDDEAYAPSQGQ